ncbi:MAG: T9SS type A sorting domain-containing protein [Cytophagales bacterium]
MKKTFLPLATSLILACGIANAQADYKFKPTTFVGALSDKAEEDWTAGWVEWNPQNKVYGAVTDTTTLNSYAQTSPSGRLEITTNVTLDASQVYLLRGLVVVRSGASLTIPAGTVIRGEADAPNGNFGALVIDRGGKIFANGTSTNPVVFTSNQPVGDRTPGDWAGILVCGKATMNRAFNKIHVDGQNGRQMEGFQRITAFPDEGVFGGTDDNDNSGVIKYTRIEYAGLPFAQDEELNSLTLGCVGLQTELHHIQTSYGNDDAFEAFGGYCNMSYLVSIATVDDDFDFDFGHRGLVQFGIAIRDRELFDESASGNSALFEIDSESAGALPTTATIFSNITAVGVIPEGANYSSLNSTEQSKFSFAYRGRLNSTTSLINSILMGMPSQIRLESSGTINASYKFSGDRTEAPVLMQNNIFYGVSGGRTGTGISGLVNANPAADFDDVNNWLRAEAGANRVDPVTWGTGNLLVNPTLTGTPDFRPVAESPALTGASFTNARIAAVTPTSDVNFSNNQVIYPNPVQRGSEINFSVEAKRFTITNASGVVLMSGAATSKVSTSNLEAGMYLINVDGKTSKLVIY